MFELYLEKPGDLKLRECESSLPSEDDEVKVRTIYGGICGSDLRVYKGNLSYAAYPLRPGHEVLGTVVEGGKEVPHKVGTKVVVFPNTFCGKCEYCSQGRTNICKHKKPLGISTDGVFAQEFVVASKYAVPVPANLVNERAILIEPFAVTVHALKKTSITKGTSVAIVGCGTEGLLAVALSIYYGGNVTALDINPAKREIAKRLGDVRAIHPSELQGETFDVVVEAAGVKTSIEQAMQLVKPGGIMVAVGITGESVNFPTIHIVRDEITICGTIIYTMGDFVQAIEYLQDPALNIAPILSKIVPYTQFQQAFDDAMSGNYGKIILNFQGE